MSNAEEHTPGGIRIGDVGGSVNFKALGDIVGGDKITNITTTIQISVEAITQRPLVTTSPYRGLDRFEERDQGLFFGRDQLIKSLLTQLSTSNVLLVLGASGSGKSSVVRAGLLPALSHLVGARFRSFTFVPDVNPFESLRSALHGAGFSQSQTRPLLDAQPDVPAKLIRTLQREGDQWLFFVDQFEEIFTGCAETLRKSFIAALVAIANDRNSSTKLVLAMRADFLDRFAPFAEFAKIIEKHIDFVADMHRDELRLCIEQPAARHGIVFEAGLVEEIIKDVEGQAGSLPLLQYTLDLVWQEERREGGLDDRHLNTRTYRELGGVRGALQKRADEIYTAFADSVETKAASLKQETVRQIFLRLVDLAGEGTNDAAWRPVRRRVSMATFATEQEQETLRTLIDQKLLVSNREGDDATVEVAHEALFTSWSRLKNWIEAGKQVIFARNRLSDDARRWQRRQQEEASGAEEELLSGTRLAQTLDMRARGDFAAVVGGLGEMERQFLEASAALRDRRVREEQARQQRELEAERMAKERELEQTKTLVALEAEREAKQVLAEANQKAKQRLRVGFIGLAVSVLVAVFIGVLAVGAQKHLAEIQEGTRLEQEGGNALRQFKFQEMEALLSAMRTGQKLQKLIQERYSPLEKYPATSPLLALQTILDSIHEQTQFRHGQDVIHTASLSQDGESVVTASDDKTARLWDLSGNQRAEFRGHHNSVLSANFSPDGKSVVTASQDGTARLWDLTGSQLAELKGHQNWVWNACFSPNGERILTASWDGTARLWDLSGKQLAEFIGHQDVVQSASFSPDGTKILTASADKTARLWDLSGRQLAEFIGHQDVVQSASFSPDGTKILTASADKTARLWDLSGKQLAEFIGHRDVVQSASFSPDGTKILTASADKTARLWDLSGKQLAEFIGHQDVVQSASFSSYEDEERIITTSKDGSARLWDLSGRQLTELRHQGWVENANFSPNGNRIVTASWDGTARLWGLDSQLIELKGHSFGILSASFSWNGQYVLTTSKDGTVRLWDSSGQQLTGLSGQGWVRSTIFSPNGRHILTATQNGTVQLWTFLSGRLVNPVNLENQGVAQSINFSRNGQQILTASEDGTARLWDLSGRCLAELKHQGPVVNASFSPDGQRILTASQDGTARLWNLSGNQLRELKHQGPVVNASFSPDGQRILTASQDGTARLWNLSGNQLRELKHQGPVVNASFSPDGQRILTASQDGTARLWDLAGSQSIELGYPGSILSASFSPDGQRILTASQDGTARLWDLAGRQLAELGGQGTVLSASFSPDGQHIILTASNERIARLWQIEDLNQLLMRGCKWLKPYFVTHPKDRETLDICQDKPDLKLSSLSRESEGSKKVGNFEDGIFVFPKALLPPDLNQYPNVGTAVQLREASVLLRNAEASSSNTTSDSSAAQFSPSTLTDQWQCDDSGTYFLRQVGDQLWWYGEDAYRGAGFSNVFHGQIQGKQILGHWVDVPRGGGRGAGEMSLEIISPNRLRAIRKTGNFGGSEWTRRSAHPAK